MKVSELARQAGLAPSAVRFYEAEGLLPQPRRTAAGYRTYGAADVCRVRMLVSLRALGLELPEAARLAGMCAEGRCDDMAVDLLPLIASRRLEVERARAELDHLDAELRRLQQRIEDGGELPSMCTAGDGSCPDESCCVEGSCG
jgi:MerR family mercuric resistance operon transcriptional regulator